MEKTQSRRRRSSRAGSHPLLLALLVFIGACASATQAGRRFPEFARFAGREVARVEFTGTDPISQDTLRTVVQTAPTQCSLLGIPVCLPFTSIGTERHYFSIETMSADVQRLALYYRRAGYFGTTVRPEVRETDNNRVAVRFNIDRGRAVYLDSLNVVGLDSLMSADSLERTLPLKPGNLFDLANFARSSDAVLQSLLDRGHVYARVLRNFSVDTIGGHAYAELEAVPGPIVHVDTVIVEGAEHLGRGAALQQLTFRPGDLLLLSDLARSQQNLYTLEIVQFATVTVAPDSLQRFAGDSSRAAVLVQIAEAPQHQVEAAVGYGTVDCFRGDGRWVDRSFLSGARRLGAQLSLSKVGTSTGLGGGPACGAFSQDTFRKSLDYRASADLTQPYFLSPRNHLTLSGFAESQSEPLVFQRIAQGGQLSIAHRLAPRTILTGSINMEHGRTIAVPVQYCIAFQTCVPELVDSLATPRWRNYLGANIVRDRTNRTIDPTRGYLARFAVAWSTHLLATTTSFVRATVESSRYQSVSADWVLATSLRAGTFFRTAGLENSGRFLTPEERFYLGGSNTVRGFDRNSLGPVAYVAEPGDVARTAPNGDVEVQRCSEDGTCKRVEPRVVPVGGTAFVVGNAELRFPSPFFAEYLRLVAFVDAGAVGSGNVWNIDTNAFRFTPGFGFRAATPVGPVRFDVAYNPYPPQSGPLFVSDSTGLHRATDSYRAPAGSFLGRLHFQLGIGQAF